jgi:dihydroxyacetone kinase
VALALLRARGVIVERAWSGTFLSALEMPGISLSLLRVDDERLALLDTPATAPAWPGSGRLAARTVVVAPALPTAPLPAGPADARLIDGLIAVAAALEAAEDRLADLDGRAGDGDLGASMVRAAETVRALAAQPWSDPAALLAATGDGLRRAIGGTSGPFYATALLRAARRLPAHPTVPDWARAFADGVAAIGELGGAKPGDRTMLDALVPASEALSRTGSLQAAAAAAEIGADATSAMAPRVGRASYLGDRAMGFPDAGAVAVTVWLRALSRRFRI